MTQHNCYIELARIHLIGVRGENQLLCVLQTHHTSIANNYVTFV